MSLNFLLTGVVLVLGIFSVCSAVESVPSFRIVAPQTICENIGTNKTADSGPQSIGVSFQPRDGIKLNYRVQIFFKTIGNGSRGQRRTLQIWKAVRELENRINVKDKQSIADSNILAINKSEVISGVVYIVHIIGTTESGVSSKEEYCTIKYNDGAFKRNDAADGLNFLLLGSENTVANIQYTLTAKVEFCEPRFDYYFIWKMHNLDEEHQEYLHTTGSTLKIPPNTLLAGNEYRIEASVLQSNDSSKIAQDYITVQVAKRGFEIFIFPTYIKIGINKPVIFEVFLTDFDNNEDAIQIYWECSAGYEGRCVDGENLNHTKYDIMFVQNGKYQISAAVKLGDITKVVSAEVIVDSTIYSNFEFANIPPLLTPAKSQIHMNVLINDLIPKCIAAWMSVQEDGFEHIDEAIMETAFGHIEINDLEENYLSEIVDYGNSTVNRDLSLNIPSSKDNWTGLKGNTKYKFRLYTICPAPYSGNAADQPERKVSSTLEFIVYTNSPPVGMPLLVKPDSGSALRTVFQISTGNAKDLFLDSPLSYEFSIKVDGFVIRLGKFYEHKEFNTQLPFSESPIQLMYQVYDIQMACDSLNGPQVKVEYEELSKDEIESKQTEIKANFNRMDFLAGQNLILMCALTYKNSKNDNQFQAFKNFVVQLFLKEIDKMYEMPSEKFYLSKEDTVMFINQTHQNLDVLDVHDPDILEKLLDLLDATAADETNMVPTDGSEFKRKRRDTDPLAMSLEGRSIVDSDYVKINLNLMEKLIASHNESSLRIEKPKIAQRITLLALKMCKSDKILKENIYSKIAAIDLQKMTGNQMFGKHFPIPNYYTSTEGSFTINAPETRSRVKHYCVALVEFPEDYFTGDIIPTFNIQVYDLGSSVAILDNSGLSEDVSDNMVLINIPKTISDVAKCLMINGQSWTTEYCATKSNSAILTSCACNHLGYYKLSKDLTAPTPEMILPPTVTVTSTRKSTPTTLTVTSVTRPQPKPTAGITKVSTPSSGSPLISTLPPRPTVPTGEHSRTTTRRPTTVPLPSTILEPNVLNDELDGGDSKYISKASPILDYVIPLICLLSVIIIILVLILYQRRKKKSKLINTLNIEPRVSKPGIKYAKFHDEHLMTGNFNFDGNF